MPGLQASKSEERGGAVAGSRREHSDEGSDGGEDTAGKRDDFAPEAAVSQADVPVLLVHRAPCSNISVMSTLISTSCRLVIAGITTHQQR